MAAWRLASKSTWKTRRCRLLIRIQINDIAEGVIAQHSYRTRLAIIAKGVHEHPLEVTITESVIGSQERRQRNACEAGRGSRPDNGAVSDLVKLPVLDIYPNAAGPYGDGEVIDFAVRAKDLNALA